MCMMFVVWCVCGVMCCAVLQAPDVATSTQLSGFVNTRGVFGLHESADTAKDLKIMSMNKWNVSHEGQHVELGVFCTCTCTCCHVLVCAVLMTQHITRRAASLCSTGLRLLSICLSVGMLTVQGLPRTTCFSCSQRPG